MEFRQLARERSIEALERVVFIFSDPSAKNADVIAAAKLVIERGFGSPVQDVTVGMWEEDDEEEEKPKLLDTSMLTLQEKKDLAALLQKTMGVSQTSVV